MKRREFLGVGLVGLLIPSFGLAEKNTHSSISEKTDAEIIAGEIYKDIQDILPDWAEFRKVELKSGYSKLRTSYIFFDDHFYDVYIKYKHPVSPVEIMNVLNRKIKNESATSKQLS